MKRIFTSFLLVLMLLVTVNIRVGASETVLLPASVVTSSGESWGYIDETGAFLIQPQYSFAGQFNENGIAIAATGKYAYDICKVYFINKSGKVVSGPFSSYLPEYINGIATLYNPASGSIVVDAYGKILFKSENRIMEYQDGLLSFYSADNKYGFINLKGKTVIPARYISVQNFLNGRAVVETSPQKFSVIDRTGKVVDLLKYYNSYSTSEGLTSYYDEKSKAYGYKAANGNIVIKPAFGTAGKFEDGYAVVASQTKNYNFVYGLIDKTGQYVVKPQYSGITYLGSGLFAASNNFNSPDSDYYSPKALLNVKGELLTDYKYYRIAPLTRDYTTVCDNSSTFFIDKKGNTVDTLPKLEGIGDVNFIGDILQAKIDGGLMYIKNNGEILWQKDRTIPLDNNIRVKEVTLRKDYMTYVEYPEITGLNNSSVQEGINNRLKDDFIAGIEKSDTDDDDYINEITYDFSVSLNKNLLIIEKEGYIYPVGAAHGMPTREYFHIDTGTGTFYSLKDLFKPGSKYLEKLTSIVNNQITLNTKIAALSGNLPYLDSNAEVTDDQIFVLGRDSIKIYYSPYEIAAYAAGFPEFEIPYGQIGDIIDTEGALWKSIQKVIVNNKVKLLSHEIDGSLVKQIENTVGSYENGIINAINGNTFSSVEPYLLKGSTLYNSQKKLVSSLYSKNIREKLNGYEIYAIEQVKPASVYKVYAVEDIAVKYSGKNFTDNKYYWCYTVKIDKDMKYKLSDIVKW